MTEDQERKELMSAAAIPNVSGAPSLTLEEMFQQFSSLVFRAAYRVTGNAEDAEDVMQTVFMRLARRGEDAEPFGSMEGYLRRAAVNAALDLVRNRYNVSGVPLDDLAPMLRESSTPAPDRQMYAGELKEWLRQTVARLSPRNGEMFAMKYFEDINNDEIAEKLGTTAATVAVTLHRIRERIQREYLAFAGGRR